MAFVHGSNTFISVNGANLSPYVSDSDLDLNSDEHDLTTYGKSSHVVAGGLLGGAASMSGTYDNTAGTGPRAVLRPLRGQVVPLIRRPEGTGAGKPQDSVNVLIKSYKETNPVADYVKWTCQMTLSDNVTTTTQ